MRILLNNREEILSKDLMTVTEMLEEKKFSYPMRIIKINGAYISREEYGSTFIKEGDNVQMIYLMSGG